MTQDTSVGRRNALKALAVAASATAVDAASSAPTAAQTTNLPAANPYGSPPGSGISMPPYYRPTPSIRNNNNYFPQTEQLGDDEMRITFMGSNPFPPRISQAGTCIMVECGKVGRFFFDFGSGCLRNIVGNQVPVAEVNDIFLTHLHVDHYADLQYLWAFAPTSMRFKPLRVIGPSGRTPELGTKAMTDAMQKMGAWHIQSFTSLPVGDGYEVEVTEFDYKDENGICYDKNGVTVRHWQRSHTMDGASAYRLDWNGLSFVWTGDGKPDDLTAKYANGVDVFVSEMVVDNPALWALKQGTPEVISAFTIDSSHSPGYGVGYLAKEINPRIAMATHFSFDKELLGEAIAEVRTHYKGMFAFGIDHTVVNVTKDALWIREAALPDTANTTRPSPQWMIQEMFNGAVPKEITFPPPAHTIAEVQSQEVRDLEINPDKFTPPDQTRPWVREWPQNLTINPASLMGQVPPKR
jgi:ribonuclease Z